MYVGVEGCSELGVAGSADVRPHLSARRARDTYCPYKVIGNEDFSIAESTGTGLWGFLFGAALGTCT